MTYKIFSEDIDILCSQTGIEKEKAKKMLVDMEGDIVKCILKIENLDIKNDINKDMEKNDDTEKKVDLDNEENLKNYRKIVDEKDNIYQRKKEENDKKKKNPENFNFCNEKKYFIKRQNEGNINIIQVL
jgi:hypothetical protein